MKVFCLTTAQYLPSLGGVERYTQNLAYALRDRGHQVIIVTDNTFNLEPLEEITQNILILRMPCHNLLNGRFPLLRHNHTYHMLQEFLQSIPLDYIVINTRFYPLSLFALELADYRQIRPIVIDHGSAHLTLGSALLDPLVALVEHGFTDRVKQHSCDFYGVSQASVSWLEHFGIKALGVLSNSIDATSFRNSSSQRNFRHEYGLSPTTFVVSFTGRFTPEKGIEELLEASRLLQSLDMHFILAGDGPLYARVANQKASNVFLPGSISSADTSALLSTADAFCMPTRSEGFSTSLLEAASWAVAPVIPNVGGVAELIPNSSFGIVLNDTKPSTIARALHYLYDHREVCKEMGAHIKQRVEAQFSWSKTAQAVEAACEQANSSL